MKKYLKYILLFAFMAMVPLITLNYLKADSGWDSDYDSGWDSDYDSGWDSGWSSSDYDSGWSSSDWSSSNDSGYSRNNGSYSSSDASPSILFFIFMALTILVIISFIVSPLLLRKKKRIIMPKMPMDFHMPMGRSDFSVKDMFNSIDKTLNVEDFEQEAYRIYKDVQIAWMNFDYEALRNLLTDEMYNMYKSQLEALKLKGQKNIMSDFSLIESRVTGVSKTNDLISVNVYLNIKMKDYVINESTNEVVRGSDKRYINISYNLTFIKKDTAKKIENCPSCGAHIDLVSSTKCPYCDSTVVVDSGKYVLSKKTAIRQRME